MQLYLLPLFNFPLAFVLRFSQRQLMFVIEEARDGGKGKRNAPGHPYKKKVDKA